MTPLYLPNSEATTVPKEPHSEPVQLYGVLRNAIFREEIGDLEPLITLKLDDLTHLLVFNESAVAGKFLKWRQQVNKGSGNKMA